MVKEPGLQYCDYLRGGEWGRGSHLVLEGGRDGWEKGWDGVTRFGMVLGEGVTAAWEKGGGSRVSIWSGEQRERWGTALGAACRLLSILCWLLSRRRGAQEEAGRAQLEGGSCVKARSKRCCCSLLCKLGGRGWLTLLECQPWLLRATSCGTGIGVGISGPGPAPHTPQPPQPSNSQGSSTHQLQLQIHLLHLHLIRVDLILQKRRCSGPWRG